MGLSNFFIECQASNYVMRELTTINILHTVTSKTVSRISNFQKIGLYLRKYWFNLYIKYTVRKLLIGSFRCYVYHVIKWSYDRDISRSFKLLSGNSFVADIKHTEISILCKSYCGKMSCDQMGMVIGTFVVEAVREG